jgi:hypothetical protein
MDEDNKSEKSTPRGKALRCDAKGENALAKLKWVKNAHPIKHQATKYSQKELNDMKSKRQAFLALFPHRHFPTSKEIKERKSKNKPPPLCEYQSKIQKLFNPVEWHNSQLDMGYLDAGIEFSRQFDHTDGSLKSRWLSWKLSGRDDIMPIGDERFFNGLFILDRDDFNFTALDSDGIEKTVGLPKEERKAKFDGSGPYSNTPGRCPKMSTETAIARTCGIQQLSNKSNEEIGEDATCAGRKGAILDATNATPEYLSISKRSDGRHDMEDRPGLAMYKNRCIFDSDDSIGQSLANSTQQNKRKPITKPGARKNGTLCFYTSEDDSISGSSQDSDTKRKAQPFARPTTGKGNVKLCFYDSDESS